MNEDSGFHTKRFKCTNIDFVSLIKGLDCELKDRYGKVQAVFDSFNKVETIKTGIVGYFNREPVACGCFKIFDEKAIEIKRMFVHKDFRGKGFSSKILFELERWGRELGFENSLLETGSKQPEAIKMYEKSGYLKVKNFGQYKDIPESLCFGKSIKEL